MPSRPGLLACEALPPKSLSTPRLSTRAGNPARPWFAIFQGPSRQNGWWRREKDAPRSRKRAGPNPHSTRGKKAAERTAPFGFLICGLVPSKSPEFRNPAPTFASSKHRPPPRCAWRIGVPDDHTHPIVLPGSCASAGKPSILRCARDPRLSGSTAIGHHIHSDRDAGRPRLCVRRRQRLAGRDQGSERVNNFETTAAAF